VRRRPDHDEPPLETPGPVIASIALGVGPLPFLGVYSVLFIVHGMFYPVQPPDITSSQGGEAIAGWVAFALLCYGILTILWFLGGHRRWPFVLGQLAAFATSVDFIADSTTGSPAIPSLLVLTSGAALVLAMLPSSWDYIGRYPPVLPRRRRRTSARVPEESPDAGVQVLEGSAAPVDVAG
jgi:xanthine/uracil permease